MEELRSEEVQDNISAGETRNRAFEKIFAWCRSAVLYAILILVSEHFLQKDYSIKGTWLTDAATIIFIVFVGIYVAMVIVSLVMAKKGKPNGYDRSNAVSAVTPLVYLKDDLLRPFSEVIESLKCIFRFSKNSWGETGTSLVRFIAFGVLAAAFVIFGLRLFFYIIWIGF